MANLIEEKIKQAAQILKDFGALEVYLFGSRAEGKDSEFSDIDFAVRGLPDDIFFRAYARASMGLPVEMDLVSLDDVNPFVEFLLKEGNLVRIL